MNLLGFPADLILLLFLQLDFESLCSLFVSCKRFHFFLKNEEFWKKKINSDFPQEILGEMRYRPIYHYISLIIQSRVGHEKIERNGKYDKIIIMTGDIINLKRKTTNVDFWVKRLKIFKQKEQRINQVVSFDKVPIPIKRARFYRKVCDHVFHPVEMEYKIHLVEPEKIGIILDGLSGNECLGTELWFEKSDSRVFYNPGHLVGIIVKGEKTPRILIYFYVDWSVAKYEYEIQDGDGIKYPKHLMKKYSPQTIMRLYRIPS